MIACKYTALIGVGIFPGIMSVLLYTLINNNKVWYSDKIVLLELWVIDH